jgi:hypothetical protein
MKPSIGRIVHYKLTAADVAAINRRRTTGASILERIKAASTLFQALKLQEPIPPTWPLGAQAHIGNAVSEGGVYPMLIVAVHSESHVNGQVFLDGNDVFWALTVAEGETPGTFSWPTR